MVAPDLALVRAIRRWCGCPWPAGLDAANADWRVFTCRHFPDLVVDTAALLRLRAARAAWPRWLDAEFR